MSSLHSSGGVGTVTKIYSFHDIFFAVDKKAETGPGASFDPNFVSVL